MTAIGSPMSPSSHDLRTRSIHGPSGGGSPQMEPGPSMDEVCTEDDGRWRSTSWTCPRCSEGQCAAEVSACGHSRVCASRRSRNLQCNDDDYDGHVDQLPPISWISACATVPGCTNGHPGVRNPEDAALPETCNYRDDDCDGNVMKTNRISRGKASADGFCRLRNGRDQCPDVEPGSKSVMVSMMIAMARSTMVSAVRF